MKKKIFSLVLAVATVISLAITASAAVTGNGEDLHYDQAGGFADDIHLTYDSGMVKIQSDEKIENADLLIGEYTSKGVLTYLKHEKVNINAGETYTQSFVSSKIVKVMLWESLESMKPMTEIVSKAGDSNYENTGTAVVSEIVYSGETPVKIVFKDKTNNLKARLMLGMDNVQYKFTLNGDEISAADIQENDVLTINFGPYEEFDDAEYYDITVTRNCVHGYVLKPEGSADNVYSINDASYEALEWVETLTEKVPYYAYLDASGKIAHAQIDQYSRPIGILTNIYEKDGKNYASMIEKSGQTTEYEITAEQADAYFTNCLISSAVLDSGVNGVEYGTDETTSRLYWYPEQVVTYYVDPKTGQFEITSLPDRGKERLESEYKASTKKVGTVLLDDKAVILDISKVDTTGEVKVMSVNDLVDGGVYTVYGHLLNNGSSGRYTFIVLTNTVSISDTPDTPPDIESLSTDSRMVVLESASKVTEDGTERTQWTVSCDGEECLYIVNDEVLQSADVRKGDPLFIDFDDKFEICKVIPVFKQSNNLSTTFKSFTDYAIGEGLSGVLSHPSGSYWNNLLPKDGAWEQDVLFGVITQKTNNGITLCTSLEDGKYINLDRGLELYGMPNICSYNFASNIPISLDDGIYTTPLIQGAKTTNARGDELLDLTNEFIKDDIVFALVRVKDDEIIDIYQIIND